MSNFQDIPDSDLESAVREAYGDQDLVEDVGFFNFVCPYCGTISENPMAKIKRKAYVYTNTWMFICYKCLREHHVMVDFKESYPEIYKRLIFQKYGHHGQKKQPSYKKVYINGAYNFKDGELVPLDDLYDADAIRAADFCRKRNIRQDVYSRWFVCKRGKQFLDRNPDGSVKLNKLGFPIGNEYGNRLIIPYYRFGGTWIQFDARSLDPNNTLRYRNYTGAKRELYNGDFIHFDRQFYILEGSIDSTFIKNSVAIGGLQHFMSFVNENPDILKYKKNCTILFDADDPGISDLRKVMKLGFNWFDWSKLINDNKDSASYGKPVKDVNDAVLNCSSIKMTSDGCVDPEFISGRTYSSEAGIMMLNLKYGAPKKR